MSWKSKKQDTVSCSSAEVEYRAMCMVTKEMIWVVKVLTDLCLPFKLPTYLYCDNTSALHIASNLLFHERTKHIENDCHKVREKMKDGFLRTMYLHTSDQLADVLTKALYPTPFRENIRKIGLHKIYAPSY